MHRYRAYGLHFQSALALPELFADTDAEPDVIIQYGSLGLEIPSQMGPAMCIRLGPSEAWLSAGGAAILRIKDGREITIDPIPGVDERVLRLFILGPALAVLLHQRRELVLHASAVAVEGRVIAFIGTEGMGKSTTAAALLAQGQPAVADDLVVIRTGIDPLLVIPGYPQLKLWADAVEALGADPQELPRIRAEFDKHVQQTRDHFSDTPLPLGAIYVLAGGDELRIEPLPPQAALLQIVRNVYVASFGTLYGQYTHDTTTFPRCAEVANRVPVRLLRRRRDLGSLSELAECIINDVRQLQTESGEHETP